MIRILLPVLVSGLFALTASADTYSWIDTRGTAHYTDDPGSVPKRYRKSVRKTGGDDSPSAPTETPPVASKAPPVTPVVQGGSVSDWLYAGKSYDQWKKDFEEREGAMNAIRKRLDEIADRVKNVAAGKDGQLKLLAEYNVLFGRFKEEKRQYLEQIEIARKAGLPISIQ